MCAPKKVTKKYCCRSAFAGKRDVDTTLQGYIWGSASWGPHNIHEKVWMKQRIGSVAQIAGNRRLEWMGRLMSFF